MSTFLALCQETRRESRMNGTGPSAVTGQTGQLADIVAWVSQYYKELQAESSSWRWLRSGFSVNTVADDDSYAYGDCTDTLASALITRFSHWLPYDTDGTPCTRIYLTSSGVAGQTYISYMDWGLFRAVYKTGTISSSYPVCFSIDPQNNIVLGPKPNGIYTITGDYQRGAQILAADGDTPEMPSDLHQLIVYGALKKYAGALGAPEVLFRAQTEAKPLMRKLRRDQLPKMEMGAPLA